jgi:hypothetical protein
MLFGSLLPSIMECILKTKFKTPSIGQNLNCFFKSKRIFDILVMLINYSNFSYSLNKCLDAANIADFINFGTIFDSKLKYKNSTL